MFYSAVVLETIAAEVKRQEAGPEFVPALCRALDYGRNITQLMLSGHRLHSHDIQAMLMLINNRDELKEFRRTPVTFRNGGTSGPPQEIPRLVRNVLSQFKLGITEPDLLHIVREMIWIHPDIDGNGRLGFVLYNIFGPMQVTDLGLLEYIAPLPEFYWT